MCGWGEFSKNTESKAYLCTMESDPEESGKSTAWERSWTITGVMLLGRCEAMGSRVLAGPGLRGTGSHPW